MKSQEMASTREINVLQYYGRLISKHFNVTRRKYQEHLAALEVRFVHCLRHVGTGG